MMIVLTVLAIEIWFIGFPLPIRRSGTASRFTVGEDEITPVDVSLKGWLWIRPMLADHFKGKIEIEGRPMAQGDLLATQLNRNQFCLTDNRVMTSGEQMLGPLGCLYSNKLLWEQFAVDMDDGVVFGDGKTVIVYPQITAKDQDETVYAYRRMAGWPDALLEEKEGAGE